MSFKFQSNFGPSFGHSFSKPVSAETPFRFGPRHCGQSLPKAQRVIETATATKINDFFILSAHYPKSKTQINNGTILRASSTLRLWSSRRRKRDSANFLLVLKDRISNL